MGGSTKSETKLPQYVQDADKANMARAQETAQIGYVPYYGPDVAAFAPQQVAAMQNNNQAADAFGMATSPLNIMQPQQFEGGIMGYSSGGMYDQAVAELERVNPAQVRAIRSMFIDPVTGAPPSNKFMVGILEAVTQQPAARQSLREDDGGSANEGSWRGGNSSYGGYDGGYGDFSTSPANSATHGTGGMY